MINNAAVFGYQYLASGVGFFLYAQHRHRINPLKFFRTHSNFFGNSERKTSVSLHIYSIIQTKPLIDGYGKFPVGAKGSENELGCQLLGKPVILVSQDQSFGVVNIFEIF